MSLFSVELKIRGTLYVTHGSLRDAERTLIAELDTKLSVHNYYTFNCSRSSRLSARMKIFGLVAGSKPMPIAEAVMGFKMGFGRGYGEGEGTWFASRDCGKTDYNDESQEEDHYSPPQYFTEVEINATAYVRAASSEAVLQLLAAHKDFFINLEDSQDWRVFDLAALDDDQFPMCIESELTIFDTWDDAKLEFSYDCDDGDDDQPELELHRLTAASNDTFPVETSGASASRDQDICFRRKLHWRQAEFQFFCCKMAMRQTAQAPLDQFI